MAIDQKIVLYILLGAVFTMGLVMFIWGNKDMSTKVKKILRFSSLTVVCSFILYSILLHSYYQEEIKGQNIAYQDLLAKYRADSVSYNSITNQDKMKAIDSLKNYIATLQHIISQIKKYQNFVGPSNKKVIDSAVETLSSANSDIKELQEYNGTLNIKEILVNEKGVTPIDGSQDFQFDCPNDQISKYLDLSIKFKNDEIVDKVACIYLIVAKDTLYTKNDYHPYLFEQAYKPQTGVNKIRILNYTKLQDIIMDVGYILKTDTKEEFPAFRKRTCRFNTTATARLQAAN